MNKIIHILFLLIIFFYKAFPNEKVAIALHTSNKITLDGKLLEDDWRKATPISDFTVKDPYEGAQPYENTEVRFLYDQDYLYIGARMYRKEPQKIQSFVSRRDYMGNSERIIITLDTYNNKQTAYSFAVTATGVRADYYHSTDSEGDRDYNYNPVWEAKTNIDSIGWTAEIAIPFSQLRFSNYDSLTFGLNVNQYTPTTREDIYWVMVPKSQSGWASRFGSLVGIKNVRKTSRIEIIPYISSSLEHNPDVVDNHPFINQWDWKKSIGLDFKMGLGPNITLDATINPDFGQVEADPSVVNLSEFEIFYDEKRPFFIEGDKLFKNTNMEYYYSRRIGAPPSYKLYSRYADNPKSSTILAATKLTGRSNRGWSFAALTAFVDKEFAKDYDTISHKKYEQIVSPYTMFNVARALFELDESGSYFGGILTAVNRQIDDKNLQNYYNTAAYSGGADWNVFLLDKTYSFYGNLGFSAITATQKRLILLQKSITQNFQRPDAKHLSVDTNAQWLSGLVGRLGFRKIAGEHWIWTAEYYTESPGLNFNDFGKLHHADEHKFYYGITYRENKPSKYFHSYYINTYTSYLINWGGEKIQHTLGSSYGITLHEKHSITGGFYYTPRSFSDTKTRGGIRVAMAPNYSTYLNFGSDWSRPWRMNLDLNYSWSLDDTRYKSLGYEIEYNYLRWKLAGSISFSTDIDPKIYITSIPSNNPNTYFYRYIFGKVKQNTLSTSIRFNFAISPDFTIEFYASPYISNGKYLAFGEIQNRNNYNLKIYGEYPSTYIEKFENYYKISDNGQDFYLYNQDFYFTSFRSSTVLRWEFLPGSLLYAVWQVNDSKYYPYQLIKAESFSDILSKKAYHSFMIKFSYWFSKV